MDPSLTFRLNAVRFRSPTTESFSTPAQRISRIHRKSDALERSASGHHAYQ